MLDFLLGPGLMMGISRANKRAIGKYLGNKGGNINFSCSWRQEFYLNTSIINILYYSMNSLDMSDLVIKDHTHKRRISDQKLVYIFTDLKM